MLNSLPVLEETTAILQKLRSKNNEIKSKAAEELRQHVLLNSRELSKDDYTEFLQNVNLSLFDMIRGGTAYERVGAFMAIEKLLDIDGEENTTLILRYGDYLNMALNANDESTIFWASKVLGKLVSFGVVATSAAEFVENEIQKALVHMQLSDRNEMKRYGAVLVIQELMHHVPTSMYPHIPSILDAIWKPLRDLRPCVRQTAMDILGMAITMISQREETNENPFFIKIYSTAIQLIRSNALDVSLSSLLALQALLSYTGPFMKPFLKEVCDLLLNYKSHKDTEIRAIVTQLIAIVAEYDPVAFEPYISRFMSFLLSQIKKEKDPSLAFVSIGKVALAIESGIKLYLEDIIKCILDSLIQSNKPYSDTAVCQCIGMLAKATSLALTKHLHPILDVLFKKTLTPPLVQAFQDIAHFVPPLLPMIQERLLNSLSLILTQHTFVKLGAPKTNKYPSFLSDQQHHPQLHPPSQRDVPLIVMALETLGSFDFGHPLSEFASDVITLYLEDDVASIRLSASLTCCKILMKDPARAQFSHFALKRLQSLLGRLLTVAIADPDASIRFAVLECLTSLFDEHLAKEENIHSIFLASNDEVFENQAMAMKLIGKLALLNPGPTLPILRKLLIQFLTEFEYLTNNKKKEDCVRLLSQLVTACRYLIKPYVEPILRILLPKMKESAPGIATATLTAISCLATVSREIMVPHLVDLMPHILSCLSEPSSQTQLLAALASLGQIASSSGYVIQPYLDYPHLLEIIISILKTETLLSIRMEALKLLGILGALDPYSHIQISSQTTLSVNNLNPMDPETLLIMGIGPSHEDYFSSVAINATMKIFLDNTLSIHHASAIKTICSICRALGSKSVSFLPQVLPSFLSMMKTCSISMLDCFFQELVKLVQVIGIHMSPYLSSLLSIIEQRSKGNEVVAMDLIEALALALESDFKEHLPVLLPHIIHVFETDKSQGRRSTLKAIDILCIIGVGLEDYLFLVLPPFMQLIEKPVIDLPVRLYTIQSCAYIFQCVNVSIHASSIIHPLVRTLEVPSLQTSIMETLTSLLVQMKYDFLIFVPMIQKAYAKHKLSYPLYEKCVSKLLNQEPLPPFNAKYPVSTKSSPSSPSSESHSKLSTSLDILNHSWQTSLRSTKDDWAEWFRRLSVDLLKESSSPSLRICSHLASVYAPLARQLFNASFASCWNELPEEYQQALVQSIITAFMSPQISAEIVQILLKLAEFMEHDIKPLPVDVSILGSTAYKYQAYAKALHYEEIEFMKNPCTASVESLISINNQLQLHDAAIGILTFSQAQHQVKLKESWYLQLQRWEDGLVAYQRRALESPHDFDVMLGSMQCLQQLGEFEQISKLSKEHWSLCDTKERELLAPFAATAEWGLGHWEQMDDYVQALKLESLDGSFFRAILAVRRNMFPEAHQFIRKSRQFLDMDSSALVSEGYTRSYPTVVRVQMLSELEEVIEYKQNSDYLERQQMLRKVWKTRLFGMQKCVEVWDQILKIRSIVLTPQEDAEMWIKFSSLCRKGGRFGLSQKILELLLGFSPEEKDLLKGEPRVVLAYLKHLWDTKHQEKALTLLTSLTQSLFETHTNGLNSLPTNFNNTSDGSTHPHWLLARCHLKLGDWQVQLNEDWQSTEKIRSDSLHAFQQATKFDPKWYKAWHSLALAYFQIVSHLEQSIASSTPSEQPNKLGLETIVDYIVPALQGFVQSISLSKPGDSLQDTLRLMNLWFKYGHFKEVLATMREAISTLSIDTWLQVIPQLIARIHSPSSKVRRLLHQLLCDVGKEHPQALIYPLLVASKSPSKTRTQSALFILNKLRTYSPELVKQGLLVSQELIRVAILWEEMWHEALEEASRQFFGEKNIPNMLSILEPLHRVVAKGPETLREVSFHQAYGRDLAEAFEWCQKYRVTKEEQNLTQAWELYFQVFRKITKQLPQVTVLELQYVSPALLEAKDLELAVPGTYRPGASVVRIRQFVPQLQVISSKQRPRRLTISGDDGKEYHYLLKGHEDLRQDERVMQLFGLVNQLLEMDPETYKRQLNIQRYSVIPLSPNSGLLGWVPHCDTMHSLIRDYRESRKILLNVEHRLMLQMAPDYDHLTLLQKIEVFEFALENTNGQDLNKVLWLKSQNSEAWLDRRTNYTRSLAVMSMVGYILGLGDRHPSNLMIERLTGKVVHIDFGDCFEVAMMRDKFPERIPFRLTRMLINAMEVSGIEGSFRITCEHVMRVLRENKESLMAVLEAFVYDPLIDWRIMSKTSPTAESKKGSEPNHLPTSPPFISVEQVNLQDNSVIQFVEESDDESDDLQPDTLNARALQVVNRVSAKLTGRDFKSDKPLDVPRQVDKLILQATSLENLCLCYIGWCAFW